MTLIAITCFALAFSYKAGERGFFPLDQSIVFDGSYRVLTGQIPYRDFVIPTGPIVYWLQAVVFWIGGVNYGSYLAGAALINALATVLSWILVEQLFPRYFWLRIGASLTTAIWFYPPFGTPYIEQTAFFFLLLGITSTIWGMYQCADHRIGKALCFLTAGCCTVLAFLSKQNCGIFIIPLFPILLFVFYFPSHRSFLLAQAWFVIGSIGVVGIFTVWLSLFSSPVFFYQHVFAIPANLGSERIGFGWKGMIFEILGAQVGLFDPAHIVLFASTVVGLASALEFFHHPSSPRDHSRKPFLAAALCVYLTLFQICFSHTTSNQWQECVPFLGVIAACTAGLAIWYPQRITSCRTDVIWKSPAFGWGWIACLLVTGTAVSVAVLGYWPIKGGMVAVGILVSIGALMIPKNEPNLAPTAGCPTTALSGPSRLIAVGLAAIAIFACSAQGISYSWNRTVHDIFQDSTFCDYTSINGLRQLRWAQPTIIRGHDIREEDVAHLVRYLQEKGEPFFVFPDFTILYGLLGSTSPQPMLWFHRKLTYPEIYDENVDRWIVGSLKRHDVKIIVLQEQSWFGSKEEILKDFPLLKKFVDAEFDFTKNFGLFEIRYRRSVKE